MTHSTSGMVPPAPVLMMERGGGEAKLAAVVVVVVGVAAAAAVVVVVVGEATMESKWESAESNWVDVEDRKEDATEPRGCPGVNGLNGLVRRSGPAGSSWR